MINLKDNPSRDKPTILLLADRKGWAYDKVARALSRYLSDHFNFKIRYVLEKPDLSKDDFDLIYVFFWGETYHLNYINASSQIIKEVSSHRWENEEKYGYLKPEQFVETHLRDAGAVVTTSRRLQSILFQYRNLVHCPNGFEPKVYYDKGKRKGKLKIGWAGNPNDPCKGLQEIIEPACKGRFDLRIAGGNLTESQMSRFYNQIDVLCIASTAEGQPLPLIEGMASGCFPVITDVGIGSELINNGFNGLILDRSVESFVQAFEWCDQNIATVRRIGRMNSFNLHNTRTWFHMVPAFRDFFLEFFNKSSQCNENPLGSKFNMSDSHRQRNISIAKEDNYKEDNSESIEEKSNKKDYINHLSRMNPDSNSEAVYLSAFNYYEAEIKRILPSSREAKIVDIGSGFGYFLRYLTELGYKHVGCVDTSKELLENVKFYLKGSIEFTSHEDGSIFLTKNKEVFDVVTLIDVIEHFSLEDAEKLVLSAYNALQSKGRVIIRTPNMANVLGIYSRYIDLTHLQGYTEYSLKQLLENAGFQQIHIHIPDWTGNFRRSLFSKINFFLHNIIYTLNDRVQPQCFDKNIIIFAEK